jgi:hypothetical protein
MNLFVSPRKQHESYQDDYEKQHSDYSQQPGAQPSNEQKSDDG